MTFVAGRRWEDFGDSVERAKICAAHAWTLDASGAATPYRGTCELAPTTAVRLRAQVKYSKRFRVAYGHHRSRPGVAGARHVLMTLEKVNDAATFHFMRRFYLTSFGSLRDG